MPYTDSPDFVAGAAPPYKIQPTIDHPAYCVCPRHRDLPIGQRAIAESVRVLRKSIYPGDRRMSAVYALDVKRTLERELQEAARIAQPSKRMTLREICDLYFEMNPKKVSAATTTRDRLNAGNVCRVVAAIAPDSWPDEIDEPIAVRYRNLREKEGVAPRTILNELSFLKMVLAFGLRWRRETGVESVRLAELPDVGEAEPTAVALTVEEVGRILAIARKRERLMIISGVTTMLRRRPLMSLQRPWINFERRWLSVPSEFMKKGRAKRRAALETPICEWTATELAAAETRGEYFWPNARTGEPIGRVFQILNPLAARAGVREFSMHDLRTTGATWLREAGVDELVVAILLGHRSSFDQANETFHPRGSNVTRGYTKLFEPTLRAAVATFDELRARLTR